LEKSNLHRAYKLAYFEKIFVSILLSVVSYIAFVIPHLDAAPAAAFLMEIDRTRTGAASSTLSTRTYFPAL
jgi:hypothetical protein